MIVHQTHISVSVNPKHSISMQIQKSSETKSEIQ
jgi:hypothetical protein